MADLLPSSPDTSAAEEADPRVIGVDSDDADDLIGALSSGTARELLAALHDDPANPAKLAESVDTTIQNAQYHLEKLEDAGLIEVVDTVYSEKGREMNVYAPSDRPLVVVAGREEETSGLQAALSRLLGALGALAVGSAVVQQVLAGGLLPTMGSSGPPVADGTETGAAGAGDNATATPTPEATSTPTPEDDVQIAEQTTDAAGTPTEAPAATEAPQSTETALDLAEKTATEAPTAAAQVDPGVEPGLLFFAGGAAVLALGVAAWYVRQ
jgi:DNA-binding transcriptional ArsR family regulator